MKRILSLATVAALMAVMVAMAMPAFADANPNTHTCTGVFISGVTPDALEGGQEGDRTSSTAKLGERGEDLSSFNEGAANCGNNR
jgi:hypothetical protein